MLIQIILHKALISFSWAKPLCRLFSRLHNLPFSAWTISGGKCGQLDARLSERIGVHRFDFERPDDLPDFDFESRPSGFRYSLR
jgi:hypothetical protein